MALQRTMCLRLEDGNSPTWGRCNRGEESSPDSQVSTEHICLYWGAAVWHAGTVDTRHTFFALTFFLYVEMQRSCFCVTRRCTSQTQAS